MKNEFTLAFNEVLEDKQLPREIILKALESAMVSAYRRAVNASTQQPVEAHIDMDTGKVTVYAEKEVVDDVLEENTEVTLERARQFDPKAELGDLVLVESTPKDFGRVAAQTARQVIQQRIRDAERAAQVEYYSKQMGEIVSGTVQAVNAMGLTVGLEMKTEASMPRKELIPGERPRIHDRVRALIAEVKDNPRGPIVLLSRTHRNFLRRLLENEVPEIFHGVVEIRSIAREPGQRAKVAVSAAQQGIDPVGACVGVRGMRIQAIVRELHDEKIDVIEWNADPAIFISKAISPAKVNGVYLNEHTESGKTATVVVPEDQLSLAIGRDGQNARLAAKLTGWRIDIKSLPEAVADLLGRLQSDGEFADAHAPAEEVLARVEALMAQKAEGRLFSAEESDFLAKFVDRIERKAAAKPSLDQGVLAELEQAKDLVPAAAFNVSILDSGLPEHVAYILQEAGFSSVGELAVQMKVKPDEILKLNGIGPRALEEIGKLVSRLDEEKAGEIAPVIEEVVEEASVTGEEPVAEVEEFDIDAFLAPKPQVEPEVEAEVVSETAVAEEEEEEQSFDKLFEMRTPAETPIPTYEADEDTTRKESKKGKKKKFAPQVEYDPDRDEMIIKRKHRRDADGWDWES